MTKIPNYTLNNGLEIPVIGFGTWKMEEGKECIDAVSHALKSGYTHIDTAAVYKNEKSVGDAIKASNMNREDLFITTKVWNTDRGYEETKKALQTSLDKLQMDYVDLYLVHWPVPVDHKDNWEKINEETWRAMEEALEEGKVKAIGVSNFMPHHMDALLKTAKVKPVINQLYLNPSDAQEEIVNYNKELDILSEAYSPLGSGTIFSVEAIKDMAEKYNKSLAQIVLRWSIQKGFLPIPKSVTPKRIEENLNIFDFEITEEDMAILDKLKGQAKESPDPDDKDY